MIHKTGLGGVTICVCENEREIVFVYDSKVIALLVIPCVTHLKLFLILF